MRFDRPIWKWFSKDPSPEEGPAGGPVAPPPSADGRSSAAGPEAADDARERKGRKISEAYREARTAASEAEEIGRSAIHEVMSERSSYSQPMKKFQYHVRAVVMVLGFATALVFISRFVVGQLESREGKARPPEAAGAGRPAAPVQGQGQDLESILPKRTDGVLGVANVGRRDVAVALLDGQGRAVRVVRVPPGGRGRVDDVPPGTYGVALQFGEGWDADRGRFAKAAEVVRMEERMTFARGDGSRRSSYSLKVE